MRHTWPYKWKKDMGDSYRDHQQDTRSQYGSRDDSRGGFKGGRGPGGRGPGGREGGGFRIRLSDNEMRAARSLQESFNLRSTVAVLGFSIRTLAQMLEEGKLEDLIAQSRSEVGHGANRRNEGRQGSRRNRFEGESQSTNRGAPKPNPFARPDKPQPVVQDQCDLVPDVDQGPENDHQNSIPDSNNSKEDTVEEEKTDLPKVDSIEEKSSQESES